MTETPVKPTNFGTISKAEAQAGVGPGIDSGTTPATDTFTPGMRVEVTQQVPRQNKTYAAMTRGVVVKFEQKKTGSWFAHSKDDKLWLDRLTVRKDDGEIVVFNLDALTHVELIDADA